jgi:hypothetical protein
MSLRSGRKLDRDSPDYTILPMPDEVIARVTYMSQNDPADLTITNRNGDPIPDDLDDATEHDATATDGTVENTGVANRNADENTGVDNPENTDRLQTPGVDPDYDAAIENTGVRQQANTNTNDEIEIVFDHTDDDTTEDNDSTAEDTEDDGSIKSDDDDDNGVTHSRVSGRAIRPPTWAGYEDAYTHLNYKGTKIPTSKLRRADVANHFEHRLKGNTRVKYQYLQGLFDSGDPIDTDKLQAIVDGEEQYSFEKAMSFLSGASQRCTDRISQYLMTQYGLKAGLKVFGKDGEAATEKEMKQMLSREVFEEIEYDSLSNEDKRYALPILLFLTRKRDGTVKGRACADGRKQRIWMNKEDTRSPTVATEALFYLLMIDAYEDRKVATLDLPGHFLQTPMDERLILRLDNELALALVEINPERWEKHLRKVKGRHVIFVRCSKAIYGTLNAALLSYKKLIGHLEKWDFQMNPYDPCVWNKMVNGKQITCAFHVDDMKVSHYEQNVVDDLISKLDGIYGKTDPMTVNRTEVHQYLGMTIDFRVKGEVRITMYDYIQKMLNDLPEDMIGERRTAAPEHLFRTAGEDDKVAMLDDGKKDLFHTTTAQSLYLGKRARPDLQTSVSFLCTRVREPDEHDYKKLSHLMMYLQGTKHLPLILRYNGGEISLYIDGAHAVHADMRGHAGVMVTGGSGTLYASSTKTKLNTTSSTETEIVSVGEKLPKHLWFRYFRVAQGGDSKEDVLYQDNEASILLENNGRMSCGKGSKHIHIRYFFVTDRINKREIRVEHCPTKEMIADYYTKPLQGSLFQKFRDLVLGIKLEDVNEYKESYKATLKDFGLDERNMATSNPQECVGNKIEESKIKCANASDDVSRGVNRNQNVNG